MFLQYFQFFLFAHLIGDFVLQTDQIALLKGNRTNKIPFQKALLKHLTYLFFFTVLLIIGDVFLFKTFQTVGVGIAIIYALILTIIHGLIDLYKSVFQHLFKSPLKELSLFLFDQFLHIVTIALVVWIMTKGIMITTFNNFWSPTLIIGIKTYGILNSFLLGTFFAAYFIKIYLSSKQLIPKKDQQLLVTKTESFGKIIGLLERGLIIILVATDAFAGVATVVALKSIARFKAIEEDRDFAEYYLVGNLWSLLFSIVAGLVIKCILHGA